MAESFAAQPPLRLSFESDVPFVKTLETVDLNESGEHAVLWADEPLTNVTLYRVSTADGVAYQKETVLYTSPAMKALTEGVLIITFFPDAGADLMAEYTDATGAVKTVLFTQSGKDGRLMTQPLPAAHALGQLVPVDDLEPRGVERDDLTAHRRTAQHEALQRVGHAIRFRCCRKKAARCA